MREIYNVAPIVKKFGDPCSSYIDSENGNNERTARLSMIPFVMIVTIIAQYS